MKKGCIFLIAVIALSYFGYWRLFIGTDLESQYWLPFVLGVLVALTLANFYGIIVALRHLRASGRPQSQWKDGDLVVVSGRLQANKQPIAAPISGKPSVLIEYELTRTVRNNKTTSRIADYTGNLMTPCTVYSMGGQVELVGFPLLAHCPSEQYIDRASYERLAEYMLATSYSVMSKSPLAAMSELNAILTDDDGDVKADYCKGEPVNLHALDEVLAEIGMDDAVQPEVEEGAGNNRSDAASYEAEDEDDEFAFIQNPTTPVEKVIAYIQRRGYALRETIVMNNCEVTVMGTFRSQKRQVNVGSGLTHLEHALYLGPASRILGRNVKKSIIASIIFAGIFVVANHFILDHLNIEPDEILRRLQNVFNNWYLKFTAT